MGGAAPALLHASSHTMADYGGLLKGPCVIMQAGVLLCLSDDSSSVPNEMCWPISVSEGKLS